MPLVGLTRERVLAALDEVLGEDVRVQSARHEPEPRGEPDPIEHASATIVIEAPSAGAAMVIVEEIHDVALRQVMALVPPDAPEMGWTAGWQHPEPVSE